MDVSKEFTQGPGGYYRKDDRSGPYSIDASGVAVLIGRPDLAAYTKLAPVDPMGFQHFTMEQLRTVQQLIVPAGALFAWVQATGTQAVRLRDDGQSPAMDTGLRLMPGDPPFWYNGNLSAVRVLGEADGAVLEVAFYK